MSFSKWRSQSLDAVKIILKRVHLAKYVYTYIETLPALNCSKLTIKTLEKSVKYVQI